MAIDFRDPNSGGFGSSLTPDLSNSWKQRRWEDYQARRGEFANVPKSAETLAREQSDRQIADRQAFNQKLRSEEQGFLSKFRTEFPQIIGGLEQQLDLPGLRKTAFETSNLLEQAPERVTQSSRGFDVNQNALDRMIAAETGKLAPIAQKAVSQTQFAEGELGRRTEQAMIPYRTEIDMMRDRFARETSGFGQDAENQLNILLQKMQLEGQLSLAEKQQANQLALLEKQNEQAKQNLVDINLGNRIALVNPITGKEVAFFNTGLGPIRGTSGGRNF